jgi:hypothetical protein
MAHSDQRIFCESIKTKFPNYFLNKKVLDVGSLDINGNNRFLFQDCDYTGIDIGPGLNVDIVSLAHEFKMPDSTYDVIISTEAFEHDMYYDLSIKNIIKLLKSKGLFLFTCATIGRPEHGTINFRPEDCPLTKHDKNWSQYYKNLTREDFLKIKDFQNSFDTYSFYTNNNMCDLYFYGTKK